MTDVIKKATFILDGKDNTKKATNSAKKNVKGAANEMARSMKSAALVTDQSGKKLSAFNEKTEKMRQLLNASGTAMGGATGTLVFYGGTIASVIGKFNVWELAILGAGVAITALTWLISQQDDRVKTWKERLVLTAKTIDDFEESLVSMRFELDKSIGKWSEYDTAVTKVRLEIIDLSIKEAAARVKLQFDFRKGSRFGLEQRRQKKVALQQDLQDIKDAASAAEDKLKRFQDLKRDAAAEDKRREDEQERKRRAAKGRAARKKERADPFVGLPTDKEIDAERRRVDAGRKSALADLRQAQIGAAEQTVQIQMRLNDRLEQIRQEEFLTTAEREELKVLERQKAADKIVDIEVKRALRVGRAHTAGLAFIRTQEKEAADELDRIQKEQLKKKQEAIKQSMELARQAVDVSQQLGDMFDIWGIQAAEAEEARAKAAGNRLDVERAEAARQKAESKRLATISAIKMALEIAEAAASFASQRYAEGAQHALAATLYAATLGKALAGAAGGGAGSSAGAGGGRVRTPERTTREDAEEGARQTVVVNIFGHQINTSRDADRVFFEGSRNFEQSQRPGRDQRRF